MNTPCPHLEVLRYPIVKTRNSSWRYRYTKKAWNPTVVVPHLGGLRIAYFFRTDNAKPTPNINYTLVLYSLVKVRAARTSVYAKGVP